MTRLRALEADITTLDVDAIVNAANEELTPGSGVCGAIFAAAGMELVAACNAIGGWPTGEARVTPGFCLPAKYVIHAVGPIWQGGGAGEAELLASAYRASIRLAHEHHCRSVAFPAISTGIYGYPLAEATEVAVGVVRQAARGTEVEEVVFACFGERTLAEYRRRGVRE